MTEAKVVSDSKAARPGSIAIWFQAIRAYSLTASATPVLVGTAMGDTEQTFVTIGRACDELRIVFNENDPEKLNLALLRSAQLHLEFGLVLFAAILIAWWLGW